MKTAVKGEMRILDATGDTKVIWDSSNRDEVAAAREQFNALRKKRFKAFSVGNGGKQDEEITEFDPDLEKLIMVPPVAGG